jgi:ribosomal protein S18 acetylase RimI-like enzyme
MKVGAHASNAAACKLYENAGFTPVWRKLGFRYAPD